MAYIIAVNVNVITYFNARQLSNTTRLRSFHKVAELAFAATRQIQLVPRTMRTLGVWEVRNELPE